VNQSRTTLWLNIASVVSVLLTLAAIAGSYFTFSRFLNSLFDADAIQTPAIFADIMQRGGSFFDWSIAPAPAVIPEYGMFAVAYLVGGNYFGRVLAYALIQVLVFWAALYGVAWAGGFRRPLVAASLVVSVMGLLCMLKIPDFLQLIQSAFHFGGFILQLVTLALILLLWRGRGRTSRSTAFLVAGIALVTLIGSLNDALFVVQLAAPVCVIVAAGVLTRRIPWARGLSFAALVAVASVVGWKLYARVFPNPTDSAGQIDVAGITDDIHDFTSVWGGVLTRAPILGVLIGLSLTLGIIASMLLLRRQDFRWMRGTTVQSLAVFGLLSGLFPLAAAFASEAVTSPRYAMPLFYWPIILIALLASQLRWRGDLGLAIVTSIACAASLVSVGLASKDIVSHGLRAEYYSATVECLDAVATKHGVSHAVGTYWVSKPTQELSRTGLTVTTITQELTARHWISSSQNVFPAYDAFIDLKSDPSDEVRRALTERFGEPFRSVKCKTATIDIWKPGTLTLGHLAQK
jgi:hypothetical protein